MPFYIDQMNRSVEINSAKRIISLVPSQTELLHDLGLEEEVIGITKFCIHPEKWFRSKTRIGGTKKIDIEKIKQLRPDLVLANKEENLQSEIEELAKYFPVWISDINDLDSAVEMIYCVGIITGHVIESEFICRDILKYFAELDIDHKLPAAYFVWREPYMTIGGDTFISDMMERAGFQNIFHASSRYPVTTIRELDDMDCKILLLSSEPYPFSQKHIDEMQAALPNTKIILVDGEMFSWYGSRLLKAPAYFKHVHEQVLSLSHAAGK